MPNQSAPAPSALLLLAIGRDQRANDNLAVLDLWGVAEEAEVPLEELDGLMERGKAAGYLEQDEWGMVSLTDKGWEWFGRHEGAAP